MNGARSLQAANSKQAVRLRRFMLAIGAYGISVVLLGVAHLLDLIAFPPVLATAATMFGVNVVFYLLYRSGINEKFSDPSLTWAQVLTGIAILLFVVYHLDRERGLALMVSMLVLSFGAFRFSTREYLTAAGLVLAGYAFVINLLMWRKPDQVNVWLEAFRWITLALVLPCFALIGGRLSEMRSRLQRTNDELSSALDMIQKMATHDTLTSLPNRALFNETLVHALGRATRQRRGLALFFLDLDRFKYVNDTLGHTVGDRVLQEAARRLTSAVRASDMVARLGGDEFVLLMEDFHEPALLSEVAAKILAVFGPSFIVDGHELGLSASIGICAYPADGIDAQALLSNADIAMYRAKEQGRNCYCFYSAELNHLTQERLSLEAGLRHALERGELDVFYQPKIDFATERVTGVEALIRWRHPTLGVLQPDRFIPLAEEMGVIVPIGYWTLRRVCERARRWQDIGLSMPVAVNLSATQFTQPDLVSELSSILRASGVAPHMIELEITESMVMRDPDRAVRVMDTLRAMGVRITIDDFGTGHSSLGYLKRFPIDRLKVDRSFVRDLPHNGDDVAITRAVIALAHSLKMTVVAEGVEHQEQFDLLRKEGCDEFQGYFCARPLEEDDLMKFLAGRSTPGHEGVAGAARRHLHLVSERAVPR
ncbi:MAG TPA: EAL domain-containing protein [Usitatibacter sp.]|nr:EAL domain-containing protein [Usitatibacter sp.]